MNIAYQDTPAGRIINEAQIKAEIEAEHAELEDLDPATPAAAAQLAALSKRRRRLPNPVGLGFLATSLAIIAAAAWATLQGVI